MEAITRQNHYVPIWYQKRFILGPKTSLYHLDFDPPTTEIDDGRVVRGRNIEPRSPKRCFRERDLYTTRFGNTINDEVERYLFGAIDNDGANAVRAFANNDVATIHRLFRRFFEYLDAQKLRTPKGLDWIRSKYPTLTQLDLMLEMQHLRQMHCTMWFECVREIVSAEQSDVKFIVTDHPVTTYNAACPPTSAASQYPEDPSIALNGTQTVFALSVDHCLVLTNLEYAKDPTGIDLMAPRENARYYGQTITRTDALVRGRKLSREDVISINQLMKARARRFIAASEKDWLYPESANPGTWEAIGKVLSPPVDELWHFGGEIYIGYKDGSTQYQDPFGRTSGSHTYLKKKRQPTAALAPNDLCGCGSGREFTRCCESVSEDDRPPWDVYSIRERNIILSNAVVDTLGLSSGKTWDDVRKELSEDQVKRIHVLFESLWPKDTDIANLLPRPDNRAFRALYLGTVDPRTIAASVTSWLVYFDEIVVLSPFVNAGYIKPEFSPVHSPGQFKEQTLKNVALLIALMPLIDAGVIHLVPDPEEFNDALRRAVREMVEERRTDWTPTRRDMEPFRELAKDDLKRSTLRLPDESLRGLILRSSPGLGAEQVEGAIRYMKEQLVQDPLALLQPLTPGEGGGQLQITRGISLELALFLAQLTGSAIYTDVPFLWKHLHSHASTTNEAHATSTWAALSERIRSIEFTLEANPQLTLEMRKAGQLGDIRDLFRRIWNAIRTQDEGSDTSRIAEQLARELHEADEMMRTVWQACDPTSAPSARFQRHIEISVPASGFGHNTVRRLLITFGRAKYLRAIPMALFVKAARASRT